MDVRIKLLTESEVKGAFFFCFNLNLMNVPSQSLMTWRCALLWTVVPSGGLPATAAAPPSLKPPPRAPVMETSHPSSASSRIFAPSCPALRRWSAASRAAFAPSPPPASADPPHLARSTGPSWRLPPRAGRRMTRAGSRPTEVLWLHLVTRTQTRACRSWCPAWTRWRTNWGKEARSPSARTERLPPGRGGWQQTTFSFDFPVHVSL